MYAWMHACMLNLPMNAEMLEMNSRLITRENMASVSSR